MNKLIGIYFLPFLIFSGRSTAQSNSLPASLKDSTGIITYSLPDSLLRDFYPRSGFCCIVPPKLDLNLFRCYLKSSSAGPFTLTILNDADFAKAAIENGKPRILFPLKLTGVSHFHSKADKEFQKKYGVTFFRKDSVRIEGDDEAGYNRVIFAFLDQKFGNQWRFDLRADAIGFKAEEKNLLLKAIETIEQCTPFVLQIATPEKAASQSLNPETETSVWWYVLPTSGFALLLSLYFIKRKKKD